MLGLGIKRDRLKFVGTKGPRSKYGGFLCLVTFVIRLRVKKIVMGK